MTEPQKRVVATFTGGGVRDGLTIDTDGNSRDYILQLLNLHSKIGCEILANSPQMTLDMFAAASKGESAQDPPDHIYVLQELNETEDEIRLSYVYKGLKT